MDSPTRRKSSGTAVNPASTLVNNARDRFIAAPVATLTSVDLRWPSVRHDNHPIVSTSTTKARGETGVEKGGDRSSGAKIAGAMM